MRVVLLSLGLALALGSPVWSHSKGATVPADGASGPAPEAIVLSFDKPMRITVIEISGNGAPVPVERSVGMEPVTRIEAVPNAPLAPGRYTVDWRGLAADGHPMTGSFSFEVDQ